MPKTNAEYCRDYRKKKREKIKKTAKSSTERVREFRARRKAILNVENNSSTKHNDNFTVQNSVSDHSKYSNRKKTRENKIKKTVKSSTERVREFRARRKALLYVENNSSIAHDDFTVQNSESDHNDIPMDISNVQGDPSIENHIVNNDCVLQVNQQPTTPYSQFRRNKTTHEEFPKKNFKNTLIYIINLNLP